MDGLGELPFCFITLFLDYKELNPHAHRISWIYYKLSKMKMQISLFQIKCIDWQI